MNMVSSSDWYLEYKQGTVYILRRLPFLIRAAIPTRYRNRRYDMRSQPNNQKTCSIASKNTYLYNCRTHYNTLTHAKGEIILNLLNSFKNPSRSRLVHRTGFGLYRYGYLKSDIIYYVVYCQAVVRYNREALEFYTFHYTCARPIQGSIVNERGEYMLRAPQKTSRTVTQTLWRRGGHDASDTPWSHGHKTISKACWCPKSRASIRRAYIGASCALKIVEKQSCKLNPRGIYQHSLLFSGWRPSQFLSHIIWRIY